jgi:transcriptional regulator with XRE-family HTH domain
MTKRNLKPICEVLKEWRKRRRLSQQTAAILLEISISAIQKWERGIIIPGPIYDDYVRNHCK